MAAVFSNPICRVLLALAVLGLGAGCASVSATSQYYVPYTTKTYPPKPKDAPIPILGKEPEQKHVTIGRLAFQTDEGWRFLRRSMIYNAQMNGADAVVLRNVSERREVTLQRVPPTINWVPVTSFYQGRHGRVQGYTNWVPIMQPGYVQPWMENITAIDAEMIVFKK